MKPLSYWAPVAACLLIVLTYLLVQGTAPDPSRHEHVLQSLRAVILQDALLERDVLRARIGILRNYDPFVHSIENLRNAVKNLLIASEIAPGGARAESIGRQRS
jgi:DAHL domain